MTDSILKKYTGRRLDGAPEDAVIDLESPEDVGAFGILRGVRDRSVMLELRMKDGSIVAVGYGYLDRVTLDPSDGIVLSLVGQKVTIRGRNLNHEVRPSVRLFEGIVRHKVTWVREADHREGMAAGDEETIIDTIECE